ncbi:MAG TPA: SMP-30/gluconolactonase/LRE family protein [Fimbriimonadaceae bacterium]|nr:SMP-30/gluconolactonase/LRE family protein [Fimbriimonadaceae bacterium]
MLVGLLTLVNPAQAEDTWDKIMPVGAVVEQVATGFGFTEGPIWLRSGKLIFSDIPGDAIHELDKGKTTVFRKPSHNANGNNLDPRGRLITCEHGSRTVTRTLPGNKIETIASHFEGKRLNSPNDVVVARNGDIYFTDPPYGIRKDQQELDFNGVYRLRGDKLEVIARDFVRPNGIGLSNDGSKLYVSDTQGRHIRRFDIAKDGSITGGEVWVQVTGDKPGQPDGLRLDLRGNVYCTGSGGVHVFTPSGKKLGVIETPEVPTNCAWGDADGSALYITAQKSVYRIKLNARGLRY